MRRPGRAGPDYGRGADAALARLVPRVGLIAIEASPAHLIASVRRIVRGEPVLDVDLAVAALTSRAIR